MEFHGFQKMTLLDYPGKVACTLFTAGCNFRCPFCHNAGLVTAPQADEVYPEEEILAYLQKRRGLLDGVAVTGGEPLMHPGLPDFLGRVKALGYAVKLDTNGSYPAALKAVVAAGLVDRVAMDIKNAPEKYPETVGFAVGADAVRESVEFLLSGAVDYEFRTTVVAEYHTVEDIAAAARWIAGAGAYFLQGFVDSGNLIGRDLHPVPRETMEKMRDAAAVWVPETQIRGD